MMAITWNKLITHLRSTQSTKWRPDYDSLSFVANRFRNELPRDQELTRAADALALAVYLAGQHKPADLARALGLQEHGSALARSDRDDPVGAR